MLTGLSCLFAAGFFLCKSIAMKENILESWKVPVKPLLIVVGMIGVWRYMVWGSFVIADPIETVAVHFTWPVFIAVFGIMADKSGLEWKHLVAVVLTAIGIVVVIAEGAEFRMDVEKGHIFALLSSVIWAIYVVLARHRSEFGQRAFENAFLIVGVVLVGASIVFEPDMTLEPRHIALIAGGATMGTVAGFLWGMSQEHGGGGHGATALFTPVVASVWMALLGPTEMKANVAIGVLIIFAACVLVSPYADQKAALRKTLPDNEPI